jgi:hypothetical protein
MFLKKKGGRMEGRGGGTINRTWRITHIYLFYCGKKNKKEKKKNYK